MSGRGRGRSSAHSAPKLRPLQRLSVEAQAFYVASQPFAAEKEEKQKLVRYIIECGRYLETVMVRHKNGGGSAQSVSPAMSMVSRWSGRATPWEMFVFGSESWGTSCRDSDIDMALSVGDNDSADTPSRAECQSLLYCLGRLIIDNDVDSVLSLQPLLSAKYPIIRITQRAMGILIDVSIADAHCRSRNNYIHYIIGEFSSPRYGECPIRQLIVFVKHWSKRKGINGAYQCYLNSFGYTMMAIKFLQSHWTSRGGAKHRESARDHGLGPLIAAFFKFYAERFDPKQHAISIADPAAGHSFDAKKSQNHWMEIHDPMDSQNNIALNVGWAQSIRIQHELEAAHRITAEAQRADKKGAASLFAALLAPNDPADRGRAVAAESEWLRALPTLPGPEQDHGADFDAESAGGHSVGAEEDDLKEICHDLEAMGPIPVEALYEHSTSTTTTTVTTVTTATRSTAKSAARKITAGQHSDRRRRERVHQRRAWR